MRQLLTQEQTLESLRSFVENLKAGDRRGVLRQLDPVLLLVVELYFGPFQFHKAVEALKLPEEVRMGWRVYWEEARKRGVTLRKQVEQLKTAVEQRPKLRKVGVDDALSLVEQSEFFPSRASLVELQILSLCVLHDVEVIDPETGLAINFGDTARWLAPLARRYAVRTGKILISDDAGPDDSTLSALTDIISELRLGRDEIQTLAGECGIHVPKGQYASMTRSLLDQTRRSSLLPRLIERLGMRGAKVIAKGFSRSERQRQEYSTFEQAIARVRDYPNGQSFTVCRQDILALLDGLGFTVDEIVKLSEQMGLGVRLSASRRQEICGTFAESAINLNRTAALATQIEARLETLRARNLTTVLEARREVDEDRKKIEAFLRVLATEASVAVPNIGETSNDNESRHGEIIGQLVELGALIGFISKAEEPDERFIYDAVWRRTAGAVPSHVFEVQVGGNLTDAVARLKNAHERWNSRIFLVAGPDDIQKAKWLAQNSFREIAAELRFLASEIIVETLQLRRRLKDLELRFR